jgi:alkylhydroperoxidase family enzyme
MSAGEPRISPLPESEWDEEIRGLLGGRAQNIFATLVRNPGLFRRWLPFAGRLLVAGKLPARERELLILRTAVNCTSEYEWGQHVVLARESGVSEDEIRRVRRGPEAAGWSDDDALLLRAADEVHRDAAIGDATWSRLAERYGEKDLIELVMLIGHYHMVAFTLNSLRVQREPGVPGLDQP